MSLSRGLEGFSRLTSKLSLRAVLKTGAAPTKNVHSPPDPLTPASRDTDVGHSLCSKKCFEGHEDLRFLMLVYKAF